MICRNGCGACCIAPSISSVLPGMPHGKPAGVKCVNLDETYSCRLWGKEDFPEVCRQFIAEAWICGESREDALERIARLETLTNPHPALTDAASP